MSKWVAVVKPVPFDLEAAKRAARGPVTKELSVRILAELEWQIRNADRQLALLDGDLELVPMQEQRERKEIKDNKARLAIRRRTLIEVWEFARNKVWRSGEDDG